MKTYFLTKNGLELYYYGKSTYGWGPNQSGKTSIRVEWNMHEEADHFIASRIAFCNGAEINVI